MVLVDTSVWIDWLRNGQTGATEYLDERLDDGDAVLAPVIVQEILQGARSLQALDVLREKFGSLPFLLAERNTHIEAGRCRWQGVTPRSPHDCLIARLAIENGIPLLHDDRDFRLIAKAEPALKLWSDAEK